MGQIGAGFGQAVHVPAFRLDPRARVVAISAASGEKARTVAGALGIPRTHASWQELVADPGIALVSIAVPPALQCEIASAAAERGKHLFLEKPVGTSFDAVRALAETARTRGVAASVDFLFARVEAFEEAERAIAAGEIGRVTDVAVRWRTRTYAHRMGIESWKLRSGPGGGALYAFGSHVLQYIETLAGPIRSIAARMEPDGARDDRFEAQCELVSGATTSIIIDANFSGKAEHVIEVTGERGSVVLENRSNDTVDGFTLRLPRGITRRASPAQGDGRIGPVARIVAELLDAIERDDLSSPRLRQGVRVQTLIDAAQRSDGTAIEVPS